MLQLLALVVVFIAAVGAGEALVASLAEGPARDVGRFLWDGVTTWLVVGVFCGAFPLFLSGRVTPRKVVFIYGLVFAFAAFVLAATLADVTLSRADLAEHTLPDDLARAFGEFVSMALLFAGVLCGVHLKERYAPDAVLMDRHLRQADHADP